MQVARAHRQNRGHSCIPMSTQVLRNTATTTYMHICVISNNFQLSVCVAGTNFDCWLITSCCGFLGFQKLLIISINLLYLRSHLTSVAEIFDKQWCTIQDASSGISVVSSCPSPENLSSVWGLPLDSITFQPPRSTLLALIIRVLW
jgi:hypothetical protein